MRFWERTKMTLRTTGYSGVAQRALRAALLASLWLAPSLSTGLATGLATVRPAMAGRAAEPAVDRERLRRQLKGAVVRTVDGRTLSLDALQGEVVVLNFWASWCPPCRRELPRLDAFQTSVAGRGARVVAISIDEEARNVERFARAQRLSLTLYHDGPDHLARRLDLPHVPFTIVLDRRGEVVLATGGADPQTLESITETTRRLLASGSAGPSTQALEATGDTR
jgi:thiol-disulfide isomerase/thioredoxin